MVWLQYFWRSELGAAPGNVGSYVWVVGPNGASYRLWWYVGGGDTHRRFCGSYPFRNTRCVARATLTNDIDVLAQVANATMHGTDTFAYQGTASLNTCLATAGIKQDVVASTALPVWSGTFSVGSQWLYLCADDRTGFITAMYASYTYAVGRVVGRRLEGTHAAVVVPLLPTLVSRRVCVLQLRGLTRRTFEDCRQ